MPINLGLCCLNTELRKKIKYLQAVQYGLLLLKKLGLKKLKNFLCKIWMT